MRLDSNTTEAPQPPGQEQDTVLREREAYPHVVDHSDHSVYAQTPESGQQVERVSDVAGLAGTQLPPHVAKQVALRVRTPAPQVVLQSDHSVYAQAASVGQQVLR